MTLVQVSLFFIIFLNLIGLELIYNVVLISAAQQNDSLIHISRLFHLPFQGWFTLGC